MIGTGMKAKIREQQHIKYEVGSDRISDIRFIKR